MSDICFFKSKVMSILVDLNKANCEDIEKRWKTFSMYF